MPLEVDHAEAHAVALDDAAAVAGLRREVVRRPHDRGRLRVEVRVDLMAMVGVVAERDDVDAGGEQLVGDLRRDAQAAGGVLAVDHDEGRLVVARAASAAGRAACADRARRRRRRRRGFVSPRAILSRRAVSDAGADSEFEGHDPLEGEPPPSRPRRSSCRAGSSSSCCRSAILALWVAGARRRPGAADLHRRRRRGADPQPAGDVLPARRCATARPGRRGRLLRPSSAFARAVGFLAGQPDRRPGQELPRRRAGDHRLGNQQPRRPAEVARQARASTSRSRSRARPRCRRCRTRSSAGPATSCPSAATSLKTRRDRPASR